MKSLPHLRELMAKKIQRRRFMGALGALGFTYQPFLRPLPQQSNEHLLIPKGFKATKLISWGDRLSDGQSLCFPISSAQEQLGALGYNNDYLAFHPLTSDANGRVNSGLLSINHEYTNPSLMTPQAKKDSDPLLSDEQIKVDMAAVGHTVLEIRRVEGMWEVVWGSRYNRRLSALGPKMKLSGPAAGHPLMKTSADPSGTWVIGTFSNCAGGITPWGTTLIAEENINQGFYGRLEGQYADDHRLMGIGHLKTRHPWHKVDSRFNINQEPHEPNRFGWIVELDPTDPNSVPIKRTALGRFKHECASCTLSKDGRVVIYSGDDQEGEFLYRFVSKEKYLPKQKEHNQNLLDQGILSVARFEEDGTLIWQDLVFGQHGLSPEHGFNDQAEVLIHARRAARIVGATPLDRPEDVEISPKTGKVYVMLTQNKSRTQASPGCERVPNLYGHILELSPDMDDHAQQKMTWTPLILGGPKSQGGTQKGNGWIKNPDNGAFDLHGRLWVTADAHSSSKDSFGNGLWICPDEGPERGQAQRFCTVPNGAEPCGPCFTPDGRSLFVSIQHPAEGSTWHNPSTRWPDFRSDIPPRPSIVVIEREDGEVI